MAVLRATCSTTSGTSASMKTSVREEPCVDRPRAITHWAASSASVLLVLTLSNKVEAAKT